MQTTPGTSLNDAAPSVTARRGLLLLLALVAAAAYGTDQLTKVLAVARLEPGVPHAVVGHLLQLHLIRNAGAAFSMATGVTWVLTLVALVVALICEVFVVESVSLRLHAQTSRSDSPRAGRERVERDIMPSHPCTPCAEPGAPRPGTRNGRLLVPTIHPQGQRAGSDPTSPGESNRLARGASGARVRRPARAAGEARSA